MTPTQVLYKLQEYQQAKRPVALVTLINTKGSSPRPIGSQMLVDLNSTRTGIISSGCIEAAIAIEALSCLHSQKPKIICYGEASPWADLRLPCGASIEIHISPQVDAQLVEDSCARLKARQNVSWALDAQLNWQDDEARHSASQHYTPTPKLLVFGRGPIVLCLADIAAACDIEIDVYSPDTAILENLRQRATPGKLLHRASTFECPALDAYCGAVTVFHDHDWEPPILKQILKTSPTYIAALGSPASHQVRCALLQTQGVSSLECARIKGPAGLDIHAQTPAQIALSIIAEFTYYLNAPAFVEPAAAKAQAPTPNPIEQPL